MIQFGETCLGCKNNLSIVDGKCTSQKTKIEHCLISGVLNEKEFCSLCETGFALYDEIKDVATCTRDDARKHCKYIDLNGVCSTCNFNFYMNEENQCLKTTK